MTERTIRGVPVVFLRSERGGALVAFINWRELRRRATAGLAVRMPPPRR